jgi:methylated-DNA-[protein]-cysteine S-methyltransferase
MQQFFACFESPIGTIELVSTENNLLQLNFVESSPAISEPHPFLRKCQAQLDEYFQGKRLAFELSCQLDGTAFQKQVWQELTKIPFGETRTYGDIARIIGNSKAFRAVGNANNKNKMAIVIPCHRVVGTDGKLTGYAGGLWRKEWLLNHEKKFSSR